MRQAYLSARSRRDIDVVDAILADEIAYEADTQALAGAPAEAVRLWTEAILLLQPSPSDTTIRTIGTEHH